MKSKVELNMDISNITLDNIHNIDLNQVKQHFEVSKEIRYKYGEINTPFFLVNQMLDLIPVDEFKNPHKKWLDIGTGCGYFSMVLYKKLYLGLSDILTDPLLRRHHIIHNMIYMSEIRQDNCVLLEIFFGKDCNLFKGDFLSLNIDIDFDFVIGNPPYNNNGLKKVPTNTGMNKKEDGTTIWIHFIKKSVDLLKEKGEMVAIIPSIWLKPDKALMYDFMMQYKIETLHCMSNTETNKVFNKYAQTPTCYFRLIKTDNPGFVEMIDNGTPVIWNSYNKDMKCCVPIPVFGAYILKKIYSKLNNENKLKIFKSNLPLKKSKFSNIQNEEFKYLNVKTCRTIDIDISNNKVCKPELVIEYSNYPQSFYGEIKLIMAHKMYGFPYIDSSGIYGISNRDNYIIKNKSLNELNRLKDFFSTKTALYLFETTRYRMKYLEKYIFELIPDITKLTNFPEIINDESIAKYFGFDEDEMERIIKLHKKRYTCFD
jgi:hypothetical protein